MAQKLDQAELDGKNKMNYNYSILKIPNKMSYIPILLQYVRGISILSGFDEMQIKEIEISTEELANNIIEHAFEINELGYYEVRCNIGQTILEIIFYERGIPFNPSNIPLYYPDKVNIDSDLKGLSSFLIKSLMDKVEFHNLGHKGKETHLIKFLPSPSNLNELKEKILPKAFISVPKKELPENIEIRIMRTEDAFEVYRCFYDSYGYSYFHEEVYYPERLIELNQRCEILSFVVISSEGEVITHSALLFDQYLPDIAEVGMSVTKPIYQGQSSFKPLFSFIISEAKKRGLNGLYGEAVTIHTYSQKVSIEYAFKETAFLLANNSENMVFKGISENIKKRITLLIYYLPLKLRTIQTIYPPDVHLKQILNIYNYLGINVSIGNKKGVKKDKTEIVLNINLINKQANLYCIHYGTDFTEKLHEALRNIKNARIEILNAYLNLSDPLTPHISNEMMECGFIFTGILPSVGGGDRIILQYLNGISVDYNSIVLASDAAIELLGYI